MPSELLIRPLALADLPTVERIQELNPAGAQWQPVDYLAYETRVAEICGAVVGLIAVQLLPGGEAEILNLAVHPDHKRQGVGTRLLATVEAATVWLDVRESNAPALAFYRKYGFVKTGHRRRYYTKPVEDSVLMSRRTASGDAP